MTIKEIEMRSGMTRANIRFYEAEGLLHPARGENGYRDYSEEDLEILMRIRLFRTLQFSLAEIKELQSGSISLSLTLEKHLQDLAREHQELDRAGETCRAMREEGAEYDTLDAQRYLDVYERVVRLPGDEGEGTGICTADGGAGSSPWERGEGTGASTADSRTLSSEALRQEDRISDYAKTLEQPAWMREDTVEPVRAPWRRYFARALDLSIYELCLNAVLMLGFRINPDSINPGVQNGNFTISVVWVSVLALVVMLFAEPLLLSVFGTTPGKWMMGFRVTDNAGYRLSYRAAFLRTWRVLWRGKGFDIPIYGLVRLWKSYRDCRDGETLDWEYDTELTQKDEGVWRVVVLVCAFLLVPMLDNLVSMEATMPRYRRDLTAEEFYSNFYQLASWYGLLDSSYMLGDDGRWYDSADSLVLTEVDSVTVRLGGAPSFLDFELTQQDGVVTGVSFHYETTDSMLFIPSYQDQMVLTTTAFACAQKGFGIFSTARKQILSVVNAYPGESYTCTCNGITIDCQVEYDGYMMLPYDDILVPSDEVSYSLTFSITKDE
ncbi:MAG: MerR family transcriptional regulator [Lachnospiraceae bacterium]|nr:MerR family transcriptional regulator [Lachnospiraceae bacterium]